CLTVFASDPREVHVRRPTHTPVVSESNGKESEMHGRLAGLIVVLAVASALVVAREASASPRSGTLHVTKECSQFQGEAGGFCTITGSNLNAINPGSKVIYTDAAGPTGLDTDIVLDTGRGNNRAFGHVVLSFATGTGTVTFCGGTGQFRHFQAN